LCPVEPEGPASHIYKMFVVVSKNNSGNSGFSGISTPGAGGFGC
jgi:hypothetical protein